MEAEIRDSKAVSISFPNRKLRNRDEKNWDPSKRQNIFLEKVNARLDGSDGSVRVDFRIPPYLKQKIVKGEISINGIYFPDSSDSELESLLDTTDRMTLGGKTYREASLSELKRAGLLI
ncbi:MAG TPA: hypothetical protein VFQ72_01080 [Candidatus Paceibacterota bacterium]|nr:hypothetical protein [Candidatus Paceibacterota bacterium]